MADTPEETTPTEQPATHEAPVAQPAPDATPETPPESAPAEETATEPTPDSSPEPALVQLVYRTDGYETLPREEAHLYWFHGSVHAVTPEAAERLLALPGFSRRGKV